MAHGADLVLASIDAFNRGDIDAVVDLVTEDMDLRPPSHLLDGIVFPGEAWPARGVAGLPPYSQVSEMLPTARGAAARLFAFGYDAWLISAYLERLVTRSDGELAGATGTLRLDGDERVDDIGR